MWETQFISGVYLRQFDHDVVHPFILGLPNEHIIIIDANFSDDNGFRLIHEAESLVTLGTAPKIKILVTSDAHLQAHHFYSSPRSGEVQPADHAFPMFRSK